MWSTTVAADQAGQYGLELLALRAIWSSVYGYSMEIRALYIRSEEFFFLSEVNAIYFGHFEIPK